MKILYFGILSEIAGKSQEYFDFSGNTSELNNEDEIILIPQFEGG